MPERIKTKMKQLNHQDLILREMVSKGLWKEAIVSCKTSINKRKADIAIFEDLIRLIENKTT